MSRLAARLALRAALALVAGWLVACQAVLLAPGPAPEGGPFGPRAGIAVLLLAVALVLVRALHGPERLAWGLLGTGALVFAGGELLWLAVLGDDGEVPVPSIADAAYLAAYPLLFGGLVALARARVRAVPPTLWLDGLVAAAAAAALTAQVVFPAVLAGLEGRPQEIATNLAYPVGDLVLLGVVVGAVGLNGWRPTRGWAVLALALVVFAATDALYLVEVARGTYAPGDWYDNGWTIAVALLAGAAWLPERAGAAVRRRGGLRVVVVPLGFAVLGLGLLAAGSLGGLHPAATALATTSLLFVFARLALTFHQHAELLGASREEALTDALTGLGNRRRLARELDAALEDGAPHVLVLFDLDGFKSYNDAFGHPAGDALLSRLGARLAAFCAARPGGAAFRLGGDEFCALLRHGGDVDLLAQHAAGALAERGDGFVVTASYGAVALPGDAANAAAALRIADGRMYANKHSGRASARRQSRDVLLRTVTESHPELRTRAAVVADLAEAVARRLGVPADELEHVRHAAELRDVGKVAIPDGILAKPGPLDAEELAFMRRHTLIGERIVAAAPALAPLAHLVRSSHEAWDGGGYPDGLAGDAIPLGARIVAVCDAFDAMTSERSFRPARPARAALAELRRCAGTQFDPAVVAAFLDAFAAGAAQDGPAARAAAA